MIRLLVRLLVIVAVSAAGLLLHDPEHVKPDRGERPAAAVYQEVPAVDLEAAGAELNEFIEGENRARFIAGAEEAARMATEIEAEARAAAIRPAVPRPATTVNRGAHSDACAGLALPEYIAWRESNCTRGIDTGNGYYGYGQVAAFHWFGGICNGLSWLVPDQEDECIRRLIAARGLAPWGG